MVAGVDPARLSLGHCHKLRSMQHLILPAVYCPTTSLHLLQVGYSHLKHLYVWVIDQVSSQDDWILDFCVFMDRDLAEIHKLAKK